MRLRCCKKKKILKFKHLMIAIIRTKGCLYAFTIIDSYKIQTRIDLLSQYTQIVAPDFNLMILSDKMNSKEIVELSLNKLNYKLIYFI
ncbi:unnamed protein product [Paramecium octaurelia]|uniref:Uncharacterized protein n=1 Tax=Paramecium octaurelia TaxID=43137 RepID=A0A8S1RU56_PAROT|nr:unnamed protein product [Paramecium octaurelia]